MTRVVKSMGRSEKYWNAFMRVSWHGLGAFVEHPSMARVSVSEVLEITA